MHQHIRTEHIGSGVGADPPTHPPTDMSIPIFGTTGYETQPEYQEMLDEHEAIIRTQTHNRTDWMKKNVQIQPDFSYADLRSILDDVMTEEDGKAFKINIGFAFILYHTVNHVFRYFYVSTNQFLFDRAFTISSHTDMTNFFNKILILDLPNRYYMQRPSSGWVLAGVPNMEIRIYRFHNILIGAGVDLPVYIKRSKSIIGLTHHDSKKYAYEDNFCLFRCLALCFETSKDGLERIATMYRGKLEKKNR